MHINEGGMAALVFQYPTDVIGKRFVNSLKGRYGSRGCWSRARNIVPKIRFDEFCTARNCSTATSLPVSDGIVRRKATLLRLLKRILGKPWPGLLPSFFMNERRLCVVLALELLN